jgi:hypothetical protein
MAFKPVDRVEHVATSQPPAHDAWSQAAADAYAPRVPGEAPGGVTRVASQGERASKMDAVLPLLPPIVPGGGDSDTGSDVEDHILRLGGRLGNGGRQILPHRYD